MADYYDLLGLDRSANADEIKKAYRKIARELHPDVNPDPEVQNKFKEVTAAYDTLSDPQKRQQYDMGGQGGFGADSEVDSAAVDLATSWMHSLVAVEIVDHVHVCARDKMHLFVSK
jgi:DnaJ-class molecular chaperone